jgi:predicted dehydrogenase
VQVFGPKGSLLATDSAVFYRTAKTPANIDSPDGQPVALAPLEHDTSNPISYLLYCIRNDKPVENPLAPDLNVGVVEILDAARESIRTGRAVKLSVK